MTTLTVTERTCHVVTRPKGEGVTVFYRWRLLLACGHTVLRDKDMTRAKCNRGCSPESSS